MNAADVFTLPSYSEGCPNVIIEALACGTPVVATDVGGTPELIKPECGLLVPSANTEALTAALDEAFAKNWDSDRIARSSCRGWDAAARETWEVCRVLLSGSMLSIPQTTGGSVVPARE